MTWNIARMAPDDWVGAEREQDGRPVLLRVRDVPIDDLSAEEFPHLLVTTWRYGRFDETGLPTSSQHETIGRYEDALDNLESRGMGVLVIVRTHDGATEHLMYVRDVDACIDFIERRTSSGLKLEFAIAVNDRWDEYRVAQRV